MQSARRVQARSGHAACYGAGPPQERRCMTARLIMRMNVADVAPDTADVSVFTFRHPRRATLPDWEPGAHVDVKLPDGRIRQYSLCGDPADLSHYRIAVKREETGRGGSRALHAAFAPGAEAHVSSPRNNFPLVGDAGRHVFVVGGIGVTPVLAMATHLSRAGADFAVHFCARSPALAPLYGLLGEICGARLTTWFSSEGRRFGDAALEDWRPGTHLYACGPQRLLDDVATLAARRGWPADHIHAEVFQPIVDENFKPEPFDAHILSTGETIRVPADRSLLDALREHGLATASSCELGVCGACVCGYRDGVVIHRDVVLPVAARQDRMTPCVSRARVSVTLDL